MLIPSFIKRKEFLKEHCTLKIGGIAEYFSEPNSEMQIAELVKWANLNGIEYFIIGQGSNLLFDDRGFSGLIIKLSDSFSDVLICNGGILTCQSGAWMPYVARKTQVFGLTGLEHAIGIPGNIGGIVTMNAGSQRKSISSTLVSVKFIDEKGLIKTILSEDCHFGYRKSVFQENKWVILEVKFKLNELSSKKIRQAMLEILKQRRNKFPRKTNNCGSVFKSSIETYKKIGSPGKILENLGIKGICSGGVCVSKDHANFFINGGQGTAKDFRCLLNTAIKMVNDAYQVKLDPEVQQVLYKRLDN